MMAIQDLKTNYSLKLLKDQNCNKWCPSSLLIWNLNSTLLEIQGHLGVYNFISSNFRNFRIFFVIPEVCSTRMFIWLENIKFEKTKYVNCSQIFKIHKNCLHQQTNSAGCFISHKRKNNKEIFFTKQSTEYQIGTKQAQFVKSDNLSPFVATNSNFFAFYST